MPELLKLIVMSDLHLVPAGRTTFGLDTPARFRAALAHAAARHTDADLCIFAGDLTDRADPKAYALFERLRPTLALPQRVLLGNHDDRGVYLSTAVDPMRTETGHVAGTVDLKGHRVMMLDSSEPGVVQGVLAPEHLDWVALQLADAVAQGLKVIVVLHHEPVALQMPVDTYRLGDPQALKSVLDASGADIRMILAGHCHISTAGSWGGYPCATLAGNQHRVEPFLRGRTGQQACYDGPSQYAVLVSDGLNLAVHFESYTESAEELDPALFPWKMNQPFQPL